MPSDDSFSSNLESKHNRGALAFLRLVEDLYAKQEEIKSRNEMFEGLVVSMLDLDIDTRERIPTSCSIPSVLSFKGWKVQDPEVTPTRLETS